mmetsp:Transcript_46893/g.114380  ORF Transcript_46893/g.114380 Transcript_46893/m.114380 type:complete len:538 (+) Transcript_46893:469-2082(+)
MEPRRSMTKPTTTTSDISQTSLSSSMKETEGDNDGFMEGWSHEQKIPVVQSFDLWKEARLLAEISAPAVLTQCAVFLLFPITASTVGLLLGTDALAGFSLGSLTANLTIQSILTGSLTAADTLLPRLFSTQHYQEMSIVVIRSAIVCAVLLIIPIIPLWTSMEKFFDLLGQDPTASHLAVEWIRAFLLGVPALAGFKVLQSFLNSQHRPWPMAISSIVACILLPVWLRLLIPTLAERGSALAIALSQWVMLLVTLIYLKWNYPQSYEPASWTGISIQTLRKALRSAPMKEYLSLSLGGVVSLSEWWFWEITCFIVGSFGVVPLCCHTIVYQLVPLLFMPTLGLSVGLTVRMGNVLAHNVHAAKMMALYSLIFNTIFGALLVTALFHFRVQIILLFTEDEQVVEQCMAIWPKVCIDVWILHPYGVSCAILRALGKQWRMAAAIFGSLYVCALPCLFHFAVHKEGGIDAVWTILPIFYGVMQILLAACYVFEDWAVIGEKIRGKSIFEKSRGFAVSSSDDDMRADESTSLLVSSPIIAL